MYPSLFNRLLAFLIDAVFIYLVPVMLSVFGVIDRAISTIMVVAGFISLFYFFVFFLVDRGKTPGSSLVGIKVVSSDLAGLTVKRIIPRAVLLTIQIVPVGFLLVVSILNLIISLIMLNKAPWKNKRQTFWDFGSDTCVIKEFHNSGIPEVE